MFGEAKSLFCEFKRLLILVQERESIGQVEVSLCQRQELLLCVRMFGCLQGLLKILNTEVHIGNHVGVLG